MNDPLSGFCKAYSTQHALFRLMQSWKKELDNSAFVETLLIHFSYDCLHHDLLPAKLEAYGLDKPSLSLVNDWLGFREQRTKIGTLCSD